jgi:hypothetical protein
MRQNYDQMLQAALLAIAARGVQALEQDAEWGRSCQCGACWPCAAREAYDAVRSHGRGLVCKPKGGDSIA